jgi:hypothetical protein
MSSETETQNQEVVDTNDKKNRSFKVKLSQDGQSYGRYNGDSPYQAANKALSEIIRNRVKDGESVEGKLTFWLIESTKGSTKRSHQYEGERIKLSEPVKYKVGENEIIKEYKNILKKIKKAEQTSLETAPKRTKRTVKVAHKVTKRVVKSPKATKATTKTTRATTKATKATTKTTRATTKATKATTKTTKATTKATTKTTKATTKATKKATKRVVKEVVASDESN